MVTVMVMVMVMVARCIHAIVCVSGHLEEMAELLELLQREEGVIITVGENKIIIPASDHTGEP